MKDAADQTHRRRQLAGRAATWTTLSKSMLVGATMLVALWAIAPAGAPERVLAAVFAFMFVMALFAALGLARWYRYRTDLLTRLDESAQD